MGGKFSLKKVGLFRLSLVSIDVIEEIGGREQWRHDNMVGEIGVQNPKVTQRELSSMEKTDWM